MSAIGHANLCDAAVVRPPPPPKKTLGEQRRGSRPPDAARWPSPGRAARDMAAWQAGAGGHAGPPAHEASALEARLQARLEAWLEARLGGVLVEPHESPGGGFATGAAGGPGELAELRKQLEVLQSTVDSEMLEAFRRLKRQTGDLSEKVEVLMAAAGGSQVPEVEAKLVKLTKRVAILEKGQAAPSGRQDWGDCARGCAAPALEARLGDLAARVEELGAGEQLSALDSRMAEMGRELLNFMEDRASSLERDVAKLRVSAPSAGPERAQVTQVEFQGLRAQVDAVGRSVKEMHHEQTYLRGLTHGLEDGLRTLEERLEEPALEKQALEKHPHGPRPDPQREAAGAAKVPGARVAEQLAAQAAAQPEAQPDPEEEALVRSRASSDQTAAEGPWAHEAEAAVSAEAAAAAEAADAAEVAKLRAAEAEARLETEPRLSSPGWLAEAGAAAPPGAVWQTAEPATAPAAQAPQPSRLQQPTERARGFRPRFSEGAECEPADVAEAVSLASPERPRGRLGYSISMMTIIIISMIVIIVIMVIDIVVIMITIIMMITMIINISVLSSLRLKARLPPPQDLSVSFEEEEEMQLDSGTRKLLHWRVCAVCLELSKTANTPWKL